MIDLLVAGDPENKGPLAGMGAFEDLRAGDADPGRRRRDPRHGTFAARLAREPHVLRQMRLEETRRWTRFGGSAAPAMPSTSRELTLVSIMLATSG